MDRRTFLTSSAAVVGGAAIHGETIAAQAPAKPDQPFGFVSAPVLMNPTPTSVHVLCTINGPGTGWVEYGPTEALGRRADGEHDGLRPYSDRVLSIPLRGLKPGQPCFYRVHAAPVDFKTAYKIVRGTEVSTPVRSFKTLDPDAAGATFTVWNDTHQNEPTLKSLIASLRESPTDMLVWNGDVTNDIPDDATIFRQYLHPAGEAYADTVPMVLNRGNHDVRGKAARMLGVYLPPKWYQTFRHGPLAGIVMDTGEDKPDDLGTYAGLNNFAAYRSLQRQWLEQAIAEPSFQSAPFRVAFLHIPLVWEAPVPANWPGVWGEGIKGWICEDGYAKWHVLLVKAKVQLVISGHTHRHIFFPPNKDRPYGQLIGGGPKPEAATTITGRVTREAMEVEVKDLAGKSIWKQGYKPA